MRVVHYYRAAAEDRSGVTAAIGVWQQVAGASGFDSIVLHDHTEQPRTDYASSHSVRHIGHGRQTAVPLLRGHLRRGDILVLHEGWVLSNLIAALTARTMRIPYVLMPHGAYEPAMIAGLRHPRRVRMILERRLIKGSAATHLFFASEQPLVASLANTKKWVLPIPFAAEQGDWSGGGGYVAWFGRYAIEHKGLDLLIQGMALVDESRRPHVRLRGYDYQGDKERLQILVDDLGLTNFVEVGPRVDGDDKAKFISEASAYVHPARWECYGIALLEALSSGAPCLVSSSIQIAQPLAEAGAALLVEPTAEAWADALSKVTEVDSSELGRSSQAFLRSHFDIDQVASSYRGLLLSISHDR
jgi:glycosyltransferase involved in cell wall biosynthesis